MQMHEIIERIGKEYHDPNMENGGFSYIQLAKSVMEPKKIDGRHVYLDIRFVKDDVSVLVEMKQNSTQKDEKQLFAYVDLERQYGNSKIIAILANTTNTKIKVWQNGELLESETDIRTMSEYVDFFDVSRTNDKQKVMQATYNLNKKLHSNGIKENIRGQFVGTCLLALKNDLIYENQPTDQILAGIRSKLKNLLKDASDGIKKVDKLQILDEKVLGEQPIKGLDKKDLEQILDYIKNNLLPYINEKTSQGQDLLNLFFTTFNKYVGKSDKNQAFTPDHIAHFMCQVARIDKKSIVLDPTCGSGAFLVHAMIMAMENCTQAEADNIKKNHIFGIEFEEKAFGLVATNMLIHGDGNSNVHKGSCFEILNSFKNYGIDVVLMNPPYNATKDTIPADFYKTWNKDVKTDPTKGFYYVYETAKSIENKGVLLCLLPLACAIGSDSIIAEYKEKMLAEHTLDAVFTLPPEVFYPGASASACCMVFKLNQRHTPDYPTFFGYYKDDGFVKKKYLGRVDVENRWGVIEKKWLNLYRNRTEKNEMSVVKCVTAKDEWLAEAYMKTDYALLTEENFKKTIRNYLAYIIGNNENYEFKGISGRKQRIELDIESWKEFNVRKTFDKCDTTNSLIKTKPGNVNYVSRSALNNGVSKLVCDIDYEPNPGNCITIGAEGMYAFYQDKPFVAGVKIYTLRHEKLNQYNAMFLCTVLNKEVYRYSYGRARILDNIKKETIMLPALKDENGEYVTKEIKNGNKIEIEYFPDFKFMENYIKSLPYGDLI